MRSSTALGNMMTMSIGVCFRGRCRWGERPSSGLVGQPM